MKFIYKNNGKINEAYSIIEEGNNFKVKFLENGKEYKYLKDNIEIIKDKDIEVILYTYNKKCFKCGKTTIIYTYVIYDDTFDSLKFPWDRKRLNSLKSVDSTLLHLQYEEIEFYPINIIGSNKYLDKEIMKLYPNNIKYLYSSIQKRRYAMNICGNCGAQQGEFYIYKDINLIIKEMKNLKVDQIIKVNIDDI